MELTQEEIDALHTWLNTASVGNMEVERPVVPAVRQLDTGQVGVVLGGKSGLSASSTRRMEEKLARQEKLAKAKAARAAKVKRGRYHPKKKKATRDRAALKRWSKTPYKSVVYGYGVWNVTEEEWNLRIGPLWEGRDPKHITLQRRWGYGTREKPYTVYDVNVLYKGEVIYRGQDWLIYDSSVPNELDIKKAPEGAELFSEGLLLTDKRLRLLGHLARLGLTPKEVGVQL